MCASSIKPLTHHVVTVKRRLGGSVESPRDSFKDDDGKGWHRSRLV